MPTASDCTRSVGAGQRSHAGRLATRAAEAAAACAAVLCGMLQCLLRAMRASSKQLGLGQRADRQSPPPASAIAAVGKRNAAAGKRNAAVGRRRQAAGKPLAADGLAKMA